MSSLADKIREYIHKRENRSTIRRTTMIMASIVVFVTTYSLVLPAITMEKEAKCGLEEHTEHKDEYFTKKLICGQKEYEGHAHTDECYAYEDMLICTLAEHAHAEECFDAEGVLTCTLTEHTHGEKCYESVRTNTLICGKEASEGHAHTEDCYEMVLTCEKKIHQHTEDCYEKDPEPAAAVLEETRAAAQDGQTSAQEKQQPAREVNIPEENAPAADDAEGNALEGNNSEGDAQEGNASEGSDPEGNVQEGNASEMQLREESIMVSEKIVRKTGHIGQQPTEAMIREIEAASARPVVPDEDAPELTMEQYAEMAEIARKRRSKNVKTVLVIRISPENLEKAKLPEKVIRDF